MSLTIVGISGPSSSGKTTLTRLLKDILEAAGHEILVIHEDDFYLTDKDIPIHAGTKMQDWDCLEAIDTSAFVQALKHTKTNKALPQELASQQHLNAFRKPDVPAELTHRIEEAARRLPARTIVLVDGFLLYPPALQPLYELMDVKLFLPLTRALMISRRANRTGYVTIEGFWEDPPNYVERIVWPNYAKDHAFLFEDGNVEGTIRKEALDSIGIQAAPRSTMEQQTSCLIWAWAKLQDYLTTV